MTTRPVQLDLLRDWTPPPATVRFDDTQVRAATLSNRIALAVSAALKSSGASRESVARAMSAYLGETVTKNMLDAYASQARDDHPITLPRFLALLHVIKDRRLLQLLAEEFGWCVIDQKYEPLIQLAMLTEKQQEIGKHVDELRRAARRGGAL